MATNTEAKITELRVAGFCVLRGQFERSLLSECRTAFWPHLTDYLTRHAHEPNRGAHRHFLPMPFTLPCFAPEFVFDDDVLRIVRSALGDRIVADQWGCDTPLRGSEYQRIHPDYQRPLFEELPDLLLPTYMLVVSFGLDVIGPENGPIEIAPGTHLMQRSAALQAIDDGRITMQSVPLELGDVLIRHPWALHRGTPNRTDVPRALLTIRYVRRWFTDNSRDVESIPRRVWNTLSSDQQAMLRFPLNE